MKEHHLSFTGVSVAVLHDFFRKQPVRRVYLFGSYARGKANPLSDIDLVVELDYAAIETGMEFFNMWDEIELLTGKKVDLISRKSLSKYTEPDFECDKILVYERSEA